MVREIDRLRQETAERFKAFIDAAGTEDFQRRRTEHIISLIRLDQAEKEESRKWMAAAVQLGDALVAYARGQELDRAP